MIVSIILRLARSREQRRPRHKTYLTLPTLSMGQ
jgi:hypothetical protein